MLTVSLVLVLAAFVCTILSAIGRPPPLWVAVLLLVLLDLLRVLPLGGLK
jgi:hypothetical protein